MKKFLIFLTALSLLSLPVSAEGEPEIKLTSVNVENEKTATVQVFVENNPGMWGMDLRISYDKANLTLVKVENGEVYSDSEWTEGNLKGEEYILSYARNDFQDTKNNGLLATLTFSINNPQNSGSYEVLATYRAGDVINVNFGEIVFKITNGKVSVKGALADENTPTKAPEISSAPQLNTFEATLSTEKPNVTEETTEKATENPTVTEETTGNEVVTPTEKIEPTPIIDEDVESQPKDNTFLIVVVGALVIGFAFYYLIKKKNKEE